MGFPKQTNPRRHCVLGEYKELSASYKDTLKKKALRSNRPFNVGIEIYKKRFMCSPGEAGMSQEC